ncbi:YoaK family protein [Kineococcus endophyticus]|uniref:YoaK family protein n=1 Tax=Kineococcus endophyticus TaxID=1181883 RepID=A0ABV3PD82_9ACTN
MPPEKTAAPSPAAVARGARRASWHLALMLVLTFSTGIVDAVGYLGLDRVFTANMTGNVVILGMALTGSEDLPIVGPVLALLGFLAGAAVVGRVLRKAATGWTTASTWVFVVVGVVLAGLGVATSLMVGLPVEPGTTPPPAALAVTTVLGIAMGGQAAAARRLAVKDVTTVVVTSTLTGLAADSRMAGGTGDGWRRRLGAVVLILAGAAAGAALLRWHIGAGLGVAALISLVAAVLGHFRAHATR